MAYHACPRHQVGHVGALRRPALTPPRDRKPERSDHRNGSVARVLNHPLLYSPPPAGALSVLDDFSYSRQRDWEGLRRAHAERQQAQREAFETFESLYLPHRVGRATFETFESLY